MSNCLKILLAVVNIIGCDLSTRLIKLLEGFLLFDVCGVPCFVHPPVSSTAPAAVVPKAWYKNVAVIF